MRVPFAAKLLPTWKAATLAALSAGLLILSFPDLELWPLAWIALVPLIFAIELEKGSVARSFVSGWIFGTLFFFGTCWWLAWAPIHYAAFPPVLAYALVLIACAGAAVFPGIFSAVLSILIRRFGRHAFIAVPFVWVFTEFLRYWLTGNNWNALGYSQAFHPAIVSAGHTSIAGIYGLGFLISASSAIFAGFYSHISSIRNRKGLIAFPDRKNIGWKLLAVLEGLIVMAFIFRLIVEPSQTAHIPETPTDANLIAIQPNVPMSGLTTGKWDQLRLRHVYLAKQALAGIGDREKPVLVVFPESPMNFMYAEDPQTQSFVDDLAVRNNISVLFNSAEPDRPNGKYFNSAVMVSPQGREVGQYDKIYLLPFGEAVPFPLQGILPGFVGNFSYGREYDLLPVGNAKAGVMICFESHFGQLSREFVRDGADAIIEMTNDGYLGPTPVLRQHLANAVFRAVETERPVLRVTNVGITAYINERGEVLDTAEPYTEATRIWPVKKGDITQTFYVRFGDWFAWLCSMITLGLLVYAVRQKRSR